MHRSQLLESRNEIGPVPVNQAKDAVELIASIKYLLHGRRDINKNTEPVHIGSINVESRTLSIALDWKQGEPPGPELVVNARTQRPARYPPYKRIRYRRLDDLEMTPDIHHVFVPSNGLQAQELDRLWDNTTLTDLESDVLAAMHIIAPRVEKVNLVGAHERDRGRIPMAGCAPGRAVVQSGRKTPPRIGRTDDA